MYTSLEKQLGDCWNNSTAQAVTLQDLHGLEGRVMTQVAQHVAQEARKSTAQADTLLDLQELEGRFLTQVAQAKPSEVAGQHLEALESRIMPVFCLDYGDMLLRPINSRRWLCTACFIISSRATTGIRWRRETLPLAHFASGSG